MRGRSPNLERAAKARGSSHRNSGKDNARHGRLTAKSLKEDLLIGLNAGADEYLTKPMDPQELELRLRTGRRILELQSELIAAREGLHIQATQDSLGLEPPGGTRDLA